MEKRWIKYSVLLLAIIVAITSLPTAVMASEVFTLYVSPSITDDSAERADGATYQTLQGAIAHAQDGDTLVIKDNLIVSEVITIPANMTGLVIKGSDAEVTVKRDDGYTGAMLNISKNAHVTLCDIIFDGGAKWSSHEKYYERTNNSGVTASDSCIKVDGKLVLDDGAQVQNNYYEENTTSYGTETGGAAVNVTTTGDLTLTGTAKLHDNGCFRTNNPPNDYGGNFGGGAIAVNGGKITIEDNVELYHNFVDNQNAAGGAIVIRQQATVTMNGGKIYENMAFNGGGIGMFYGGGHFIMNDGIIANNTARMMGGGVRVYSAGGLAGPATFTMNGGKISGNTVSHGDTDGSGGGVHLYDQKDTFIMTGGVIENNFAQGSGGGVTVASVGTSASAVILGGTIHNNRIIKRYDFPEGYAISCRGNLYLNGKAAIIEGDIHLNGANPINLIGAPDMMNDYLVSTFGTGADGRIIVKPGQYTYDGKTYVVTDAEPFVDQFSHTHKGVIKGSDYGASPSEGNLVLYGMTVSFDMNKPTGVTAPTSPESIRPLIAAPNKVIMELPGFPADPALEGYLFDGWYTHPGCFPTSQLKDTTQTGQSHMTLYAKWKIPTAKVTFLVGDENKGKMEPEEATWEVNQNTTVDSQGEDVPVVTAKTGWKFICWKDDINGGRYDSIAAANYLVTEDVVLTAQYVESDHALVFFDFNGGTDGNGSFTYLSGQPGTAYTEPAPPTKEGYLFDGWQPSPDGIFGEAGSTITYTAQWKASKNKVSFDPGTDGTITGDTEEEVAYGEFVKNIPSITANRGYVFVGWSNNNGIYNEEAVKTYPITGDVVFTAQYEKSAKAVVIFDYNGGTAESRSSSYVSGQPGDAYKVPVPEREGYLFKEWHPSTPTGAFGDAGTIEAYIAQWTTNEDTETFFVTFDKGEYGTMNPATHSENVVSGELVNLVPQITADSGYTFLGWSLNKGSDYHSAEEIKTMPITGISAFVAMYQQTSTGGGGNGGGSKGKGGSKNIPDEKPPLSLLKEDHIAYVKGYPEGDFRPERTITRAEAAQLFYNLLINVEKKGYTAQFADVKSSAWYSDAVNCLGANGVILGYPDGSFQPDNPITRAEFATLSSKFDKLSLSENNRFADVKDGHWAVNYINSAAVKGWIKGYENGEFRPERNITRAEVVTLVNAILERKVSLGDILKEAKGFTDLVSTHWAYCEIMEAANAHNYSRKADGLSEVWHDVAN